MVAAVRTWEAITRHPVATIFIVALVIRLIAVGIVNLFPGGYFVLDDSTYTGMAEAVANQRLDQWDFYTHELYRSTFVFVFPIALLFDVFGRVEWIAQVYVALLGSLTAALVAAVALRFTSRGWAATAGLIIAFLPSQIIWSSLILKDAAVWAVLAALCLAIVVANGSERTRLLGLGLLIAGLLVALAHLRDHTMVVASWSLVGAAFFGRSGWRSHRVAGAVLIAVAIPWVIGTGPAGMTLVADAGSLQERRIKNAENAQSAFVAAAEEEQEDPLREAVLQQEVASKKGLLEVLERQVATLEAKFEKARDAKAQPPGDEPAGDGEAKTGEEASRPEELAAKVQKAREKKRRVERSLRNTEQRLVAVDGEPGKAGPPPSDEVGGSLEADVRHLPKGVSVMLFAPYPWQETTSQTMRMAQLEMLIWYPLLVLAAIGLWRARKNLQALVFPILVAGGMLVVYGLAEGNIGTAYRHRGEITWTIVLLAVLGLHYLSERRRRSRHR